MGVMKAWMPAVLAAVSVLAGACRRESPGAAKTSTAFTITGLTAEPAGDHAHVIITVKATGPASGPVTLAPPACRLWTSSGEEVPPFIAPGLEPAILTPGVETEAATHWWLRAKDLKNTLELEINGTRAGAGTASP